MLGRLATLVGLAFLGSLHAADIYRWVDETGRTHMSDTVPEQYRKSATRTDARKFEVSDEQRREAEARAERDRAKVRASEEARSRSLEPGQAAPAAGAPKPAASAAGDCAEQYRRYRESLDCFAPYVIGERRHEGRGLQQMHGGERPQPPMRAAGIAWWYGPNLLKYWTPMNADERR